ncbi:MAG: hypothetical protein AUH29_04615 [Candidatus Rokubacteria bacterium 13_1_40CM_69_27]|nr:MAG: hypothetical protein AUH29_04615 [Candidatus Rokubacteria bacterium 13_1_40CM_69_27]
MCAQTAAIPLRHPRHGSCVEASPVHRMRPLWIRGLRLYRSADPTADEGGLWPGDEEREPLPDVRSRFQSVDDPDCFALYSVRNVPLPSRAAPPVPLLPTEDHTLIVVREFRRVPLEASALALMIFSARVGAAARVIATLAHWAERAVSTYQPAYLLLAHSRELLAEDTHRFQDRDDARLVVAAQHARPIRLNDVAGHDRPDVVAGHDGVRVGAEQQALRGRAAGAWPPAPRAGTGSRSGPAPGTRRRGAHG